MEIEGVSSQIQPVLQAETEPQTTPAVEETAEVPDATEQEENDSGETKGVIRNLLDGHFKGVSDVRLRINHFEELAAVENEELKAMAEEEVTGVLDIVDSEVNNILGSGELFAVETAAEDETVTVLGLHQEFVDTVNQLNAEFRSADAPSTDTLISGIENAFAIFVESLQSLLVPTVEDDSSVDDGGGQETKTVETPAGEPESTAATGPDYPSLIEEMDGSFETAMAELAEALNAIGVLPELSEPSGNGEAYEKFLAIYDQMLGVETAGAGTVSSIEVDATA